MDTFSNSRFGRSSSITIGRRRKRSKSWLDDINDAAKEIYTTGEMSAKSKADLNEYEKNQALDKAMGMIADDLIARPTVGIPSHLLKYSDKIFNKLAEKYGWKMIWGEDWNEIVLPEYLSTGQKEELKKKAIEEKSKARYTIIMSFAVTIIIFVIVVAILIVGGGWAYKKLGKSDNYINTNYMHY